MCKMCKQNVVDYYYLSCYHFNHSKNLRWWKHCEIDVYPSKVGSVSLSLGLGILPGFSDLKTQSGTDSKIQVRVQNRNRKFYPIGSKNGGSASSRFGSRNNPGPDWVFLEPKILELMSLEIRCTYPLVLYIFPVFLVYRFYFPQKTIEKRKLGFITHKYENQVNNKLE